MSTPDQQISLVSALTRLLRPLIGYLLSKGFTYTRLIQIIRPLYVDLAIRQYTSSNGVLSDSRISLLTGIARRYVKELRQFPVPSDPDTLKSPPTTKIVADWVTNRRFLDPDGKPRPLHKLVQSSGEPSFEELALLATNDVHARTLLDDLVERSLVQVDREGMLLLTAEAYQPDKRSQELIDYFGQHVSDHLYAATNNLDDRNVPMFERSAFQDKLSSESVEKLREFAEQQAMQSLRSVYAYAAELADADKNNPDNVFRFRMGIYCYDENEEGAEEN